MVQIFKPEAKPDKSILCTVCQFGWIDIGEAYRTGQVQGDFEGAELSTNGIEDPSSIMGKPDDVFSAMRMKSFIDKSVSSKNSTVSPTGPETTE